MQFADAVNELEAAQVLRGTAFAHDLVFDAVRDSVPAGGRAARHAPAWPAWLEPHGGEPARVGAALDSPPGRRGAGAALAGAAAERCRRGAAPASEQIALSGAARADRGRRGDRAAAFDVADARRRDLQVTLDGEGGHGLAASATGSTRWPTDVERRIRAGRSSVPTC